MEANKEKTQLIFILDKSGSMCGLEESTIAGYNELIKKTKEDLGEGIIVDTVLFSNNLTVVEEGTPINDVKKMTNKIYETDGCTALLDAIGFTINRVSNRNEGKDMQTLVYITTDGMENASNEYTYGSIKKLIQQKEKDGWKVTFIGANIDVELVGRTIGVKRENSIRYDCTIEGTKKMYAKMCCCIKKDITKKR